MENLYCAFNGVKSQKIADTGAWRTFSQVLLICWYHSTRWVGVSWLLLQVVVHRISFALKGCS